MSNVEIEKATGNSANTFYAQCNKLAYPDGFSLVGPTKCILRSSYSDTIHHLINFTVRNSDVFVLSFPKCGSTWLQEMVWLIGTNLDFEGAKCQLHKRVPFLGFPPKTSVEAHHEFDSLSERKSPRFIKSHLPFPLLPIGIETEGAKMIYVVRNPKDTCVSYFHFSVLAYGYKGTLKEFTDAFLSDNVPYAPYWNHVNSFWNIRHSKNLLILTFEEMKRDLRSVVEKIATFLDKSLNEEGINKLLDHLSFESMRKNPFVNLEDMIEVSVAKYGTQVGEEDRFFRKGKVGTWKEEMTKEMSTQFDQWNQINGIQQFYSI